MSDDNNLEDDTKIYRFIDFFSFCNIVEKRMLCFSKLSTFNDENEQINHILKHLLLMGGPCFDDYKELPYTKDQASKTHELIKNNYFASCWTLEPESNALWSLYSMNCTGVRICTTVGKLNKTIKRYFENEGIKKIKTAGANNPVNVICKVSIEKVQYMDLNNLYNQIITRGKAYKRLKDRYDSKNIDFYKSIFNFNNENKKINKNTKYILLLNHVIKNNSYEYEHEIRAILSVGTICLNQSNFDIWSKNAYDDTVNYTEGFSKLTNINDFPNYIEIPIQNDFVNDVCIDPRCVSFKADVMRRFIQRYEIPESYSNSFTYIPDYL